MTLLKYAIKNIKKEPVVNALTVLQLTAVIVIVIIMVSSVLIRYRYYLPFQDIFKANGIFCDFSQPANYDEENLQNPYKYLADDEIKNHITDIENIISCNSGPCWFVDENGDPLHLEFTSIFYDDEIIERYEPEIAKGRWLNASDEANCIECVISENEFGLKVGDRVKLAFFSLEEKDMFQEVIIVGMLSESTKIVGYQQSGKETRNADITALYGGGGFNSEDRMTVLLSSNFISQNTTVLQGIFGPALITFPKDYSNEKIEQVRQQLSDYNCNTSYMLSEMNRNSISYIYEQIKNLLPITIVLIIMTVVSGVSSSALSARQEMKGFAVLYITGLQWKQCAIISLMQSLIMTLCALTLTNGCIFIMKFFEHDMGIKLIFQWQTFLCVAVIIVFFVFMSLIMPLLMLSKSTPKQILTR